MHVIEVHKINVFLFQSHIVRHTSACVYVFDSSHNIMCTLVIHEHMYSICTSIGKCIEFIILYFHSMDRLHFILLHLVIIFKLSGYLFRMELLLLSVIM